MEEGKDRRIKETPILADRKCRRGKVSALGKGCPRRGTFSPLLGELCGAGTCVEPALLPAGFGLYRQAGKSARST
jgi:hypothetical protein